STLTPRVEESRPYGGSVAIACNPWSGTERASPRTKPRELSAKCLRFRRAPRIMRRLASIATTSHPITAASIAMPPTPENGSAKLSLGLARARFTMHLAVLGGIVAGWKTGRFRGLRGAINPEGLVYATI